MRISAFGLGYVGCVSAACLSQNGYEVLGPDISSQKVGLISSGRAQVIEPGLDSLVRQAVQSGAMQVTSDSEGAVRDSDVSMICLGMPTSRNGSVDLQYVESFCRETGTKLADKNGYRVVVIRITVLPGMTGDRLIPILEECSSKSAGSDVGIRMNPEFLRESNAVSDFFDPRLVIIGGRDERNGEILETIYSNVQATSIRTTLRTAEMVKYANNAFGALKVTFASEVGVRCKPHAIDGREVMEILCQDSRLNISKTQPEARAFQPIPAAAYCRRYPLWPIAQTV